MPHPTAQTPRGVVFTSHEFPVNGRFPAGVLVTFDPPPPGAHPSCYAPPRDTRKTVRHRGANYPCPTPPGRTYKGGAVHRSSLSTVKRVKQLSTVNHFVNHFKSGCTSAGVGLELPVPGVARENLDRGVPQPQPVNNQALLRMSASRLLTFFSGDSGDKSGKKSLKCALPRTNQGFTRLHFAFLCCE